MELRISQLEQRLVASETKLQEEKLVTRALDQELHRMVSQHESVKNEIHVELASVRRDLRVFLGSGDIVQDSQKAHTSLAIPSDRPTSLESDQSGMVAGEARPRAHAACDPPGGLGGIGAGGWKSWEELEVHVANLHSKAQDCKDAMVFWKKKAMDAEVQLTRRSRAREDLDEQVKKLKGMQKDWAQERSQLLDLLDALQAKNGELYDKWWDLHLQVKSHNLSQQNAGSEVLSGGSGVEEELPQSEKLEKHDDSLDLFEKGMKTGARVRSQRSAAPPAPQTMDEVGRMKGGKMLQAAQNEFLRASALKSDRGDGSPARLGSPMRSRSPRVLQHAFSSDLMLSPGRASPMRPIAQRAHGGMAGQEGTDRDQERKQRKKERKQQLRQRERACEMMYEAFLTAATATGNACKMCRDQFRTHSPDTHISKYAHSHNYMPWRVFQICSHLYVCGALVPYLSLVLPLYMDASLRGYGSDEQNMKASI